MHVRVIGRSTLTKGVVSLRKSCCTLAAGQTTLLATLSGLQKMSRFNGNRMSCVRQGFLPNHYFLVLGLAENISSKCDAGHTCTLHANSDRRVVCGTCENGRWAWECKGRYDDGVLFTWLTEDETRESIPPLTRCGSRLVGSVARTRLQVIAAF